ncbi:hypothetical protein J9303_08795 [Bacillaceae bacterium Marseille-Q3522]|nr:hypothetical protein [Bacillaceae bacterium Marseille-Q3522]
MQIVKPIEDLFIQAEKEDLLKKLPHEILETLFNSAVTSLAKLYIKGEVKLEDSTLNPAIDAIWDMIKK